MTSSLGIAECATQVWAAVVQAHDIPPEALGVVRKATWDEVQMALLHLGPPQEFKTDQADSLLAATGLELRAASALERQGFDPAFWIEKSADLRAEHGEGAARRQREALADAAGALQDDALYHGELRLQSPFDGRVRRSRSSFVLGFRRSEGGRAVGDQAAYFFSDEAPLFALFGGEEAWPMAWYDPVADVIVRERGFIEIKHFFSYAVAQLKTLFARNPHLVRAYVDDPGPRTTALWLGCVDYLSTHLFSDLAGLDRVVSNGVVRRVDRVLVAAREYFGPVELLFPELDPAKVVRVGAPDLESLTLAIARDKLFVVRPARGFSTAAVVKRILHVARARVDPSSKAAVDELKALGAPILFVALRLHNRRWRCDAAELAELLSRVCRRLGGAALVLDGYGLTDAESVDSAVARAELDFIAGVRAALPDEILTLVTAGRPLSDGVYAATKCDLHLSSQGTTTVKPVLIADKPGVVIGPSSFWWDVRDYRFGARTLVTLGPGLSVDEDPERWTTTDFDLPTSLVEDALLAVHRHEVASTTRSAFGESL